METLDVVAVAQYEGPLGLLLELIDSGKVEVSTVSVGYITSRYVERMSRLEIKSPEELSEFAQLGSRLLYIKSLSLLPDASPDEPPEELTQLNRELTHYRQMQQMAAILGRRTSSRTWPKSMTDSLDPAYLPYPELDIEQLADAFRGALAKMTPIQKPTVVKHHVPQSEFTARIKSRLLLGSFDLDDFLAQCQSRIEIVVAFSALLELWRDGQVRITQPSQFAIISVEAADA